MAWHDVAKPVISPTISHRLPEKEQTPNADMGVPFFLGDPPKKVVFLLVSFQHQTGVHPHMTSTLRLCYGSGVLASGLSPHSWEHHRHFAEGSGQFRADLRIFFCHCLQGNPPNGSWRKSGRAVAQDPEANLKPPAAETKGTLGLTPLPREFSRKGKAEVPASELWVAVRERKAGVVKSNACDDQWGFRTPSMTISNPQLPKTPFNGYRDSRMAPCEAGRAR